MTICISLELRLLNFERLDMWCAWIGHPSEKYWPFEYLESFHWSISSVSIYDSPESDIRVKPYDHFNFPRASVVQFERLDILSAWIEPPCEKLWPFEFLYSFCCSISSVSICDTPESDIWMKSYDHLNFSRAFVVQVQTSRYIMRLNRTSLWKVMTIWIHRELPLFKYERLDILCAWIGPPCEKLWLFKYFESFHWSISSVLI